MTFVGLFVFGATALPAATQDAHPCRRTSPNPLTRIPTSEQKAAPPHLRSRQTSAPWCHGAECRRMVLLRGGAYESQPTLPLSSFDDDRFSDSEVVEEQNGLFVPVGPARRRNFLFHSESHALAVSNESSVFFVKAPGSVLNPFNWRTMARFSWSGAPQRSVRLMPMNKDEDQEGPLVMIDGADDIATALQGSGLPQNVAKALQACILPLAYCLVFLHFLK